MGNKKLKAPIPRPIDKDKLFGGDGSVTEISEEDYIKGLTTEISASKLNWLLNQYGYYIANSGGGDKRYDITGVLDEESGRYFNTPFVLDDTPYVVSYKNDGGNKLSFNKIIITNNKISLNELQKIPLTYYPKAMNIEVIDNMPYICVGRDKNTEIFTWNKETSLFNPVSQKITTTYNLVKGLFFKSKDNVFLNLSTGYGNVYKLNKKTGIWDLKQNIPTAWFSVNKTAIIGGKRLMIYPKTFSMWDEDAEKWVKATAVNNPMYTFTTGGELYLGTYNNMGILIFYDTNASTIKSYTITESDGVYTFKEWGKSYFGHNSRTQLGDRCLFREIGGEIYCIFFNGYLNKNYWCGFSHGKVFPANISIDDIEVVIPLFEAGQTNSTIYLEKVIETTEYAIYCDNFYIILLEKRGGSKAKMKSIADSTAHIATTMKQVQSNEQPNTNYKSLHDIIINDDGVINLVKAGETYSVEKPNPLHLSLYNVPAEQLGENINLYDANKIFISTKKTSNHYIPLEATKVELNKHEDGFCQQFNGEKWVYKTNPHPNHLEYCKWDEEVGYIIDETKKEELISVISTRVKSQTENNISKAIWVDEGEEQEFTSTYEHMRFTDTEDAKNFIATLKNKTMEELIRLLNEKTINFKQ